MYLLRFILLFFYDKSFYVEAIADTLPWRSGFAFRIIDTNDSSLVAVVAACSSGVTLSHWSEYNNLEIIGLVEGT